MAWDILKGNWKQLSGKVKEKWGQLTDDDLTAIDGRREQLAGRLQERYGYARNEAERLVDEFADEFRTDSDDADFDDYDKPGMSTTRR